MEGVDDEDDMVAPVKPARGGRRQTSDLGSWERGSDGTFNDLKKERFATALASSKTCSDAAKEVGIGYNTALAWAKHTDMQERKRALRSTPAVSQIFRVSIAMIVAELHRNAMEARDAQQFKASNDALKTMYDIAKDEKSLLEAFEAKGEDVTSASDVAEKMKAHIARLKANRVGD